MTNVGLCPWLWLVHCHWCTYISFSWACSSYLQSLDQKQEELLLLVFISSLIVYKCILFLFWRKYRMNPDTDVTRGIVTSSSHHDTGSGHPALRHETSHRAWETRPVHRGLHSNLRILGICTMYVIISVQPKMEKNIIVINIAAYCM